MGAWANRAAGSAAIAGLVFVQGVTAQENGTAPRGTEFTLDLAQSLFVGDNLSNISNPTGNSAVLETDLTFGIKSVTRTQSFIFKVGSTFELGHMADNGGSVSDFADPVSSLAYTRESGNAKFAFNGSYRRSAVTDTTITDIFTNEDLIIDNGDREETRLSTSLEWGEGGPHGGSVGYSFSNRNYTNTARASLIDSETETFNAGLFVMLNRATRLSFSARQSQIREDDALLTTQTNTTFGLSLSHQISEATTLTAGLSDTEITTDTTTAGTRGSVVDDGLGFNFGVSHDLRNGSVSASYSRGIERNGHRDTLRLTRALDLPSGALSFSVGGTRRNGTGFDPLYGLTYSQELKRAEFQIKLNQTASTDTNGDGSINTGLSARYTQELTEISSLEVFGTLSDSHVTSGTDPDRSSKSIGIAYNRALTEDWSLRTGYNHRESKTASTTTLRSNQVFMTVRRSFNLRP